MSLQSPSQLLEITIISAHDLPPVSKTLRTFSVAYVHPDHKLTTQIDRHGHTNPAWNYKVSFPVDDKFLRNPCATIMFEIYNLAWLRNLPIGTARLAVVNLFPPLHRNPAHRRVSLQICRPSGHLRGTLNISVQLVNQAIPGRNICAFPTGNSGRMDNEERRGYDSCNEEAAELRDQEKDMGSRNTTSMRPLPSTVAADLRKGFNLIEWKDYRSSIFDTWTEPSSPWTPKVRQHEKEKTGLLSCFFFGWKEKKAEKRTVETECSYDEYS